MRKSFPKLKTALFLLAAFTTFLTPIKGLLLLMILFIGVDTIYAIYVSVKLNGWSSFKSSKFFNIVVKSFFYLLTIILCFMMDKFIFEGVLLGVPLLLTKLITSVFCYNEIKSLDETYQKADPTNRSFWVIFKEFISKLKDVKKDLTELVSTDKDDDKESPE